MKERPVRILALREIILFFAVSVHFLSLVRKIFLYLQPKESLLIMSEDIGIPIFGPKTIEEAINRVDQAWAERNDPNKWITSEQMWNRLYEKYPWLR